MNLEEKRNLYYKGVWFDTCEELIDYSINWGKKSLTHETANEILKHISRDIFINIGLRGREFTNSEFSQYALDLFLYAMEMLDKNKKLKNG